MTHSQRPFSQEEIFLRDQLKVMMTEYSIENPTINGKEDFDKMIDTFLEKYQDPKVYY